MGIDRRYLKAGRYVVLDTDTGGIEVYRKRTYKDRQRRLFAFITKPVNLELCRIAIVHGHGHSDYRRSAAGKKLVKKARKALGFSEKTGTGDIYYHLLFHFRADVLGKQMARYVSPWFEIKTKRTK